MFAPLCAGLNIVIDNKTAFTTFYRNIVRKKFYLFTALGTFLDGKCRGLKIGCTGAFI
ncbi:MAG: hypothetical protein ABR887_00215 [Methanoregulaceae archaeon]